VRASFFATLVTSNTALACDICSLSNVSTPYKPAAGSLHLGIAEQFTGFDTIRDGTKKVENAEHQRMESSVTQISAGYDLTDSMSAQAILPIINRRYSRSVDGKRERGTEAGVGDLTLLARFVPYQHDTKGLTVIPHLFMGVKLPTGNSDRLKEELSEDHHHEEELMVPSAVHGHDLALGSGSTDVPFGLGLFVRSGRAVFEADFEYCIRTGGSHQYQYADDILFSAAPGVFLVDDQSKNIGLFAELSGENKAKDSGADGELQADTALEALYLGPKLQASFGRNFDTELAVSWPVHYETSAPQIAASYRIQASLGWRF
jgi:hypothetical protein